MAHPVAKSRPCPPLHCPLQGQTALPPPPASPRAQEDGNPPRAPTGGGVCQIERGLTFPRRLKQHAPPPTLPFTPSARLTEHLLCARHCCRHWGSIGNKRRPISWCSPSRLGSAAFVHQGQRVNILGFRATQLCLYSRKPLSRQMGVGGRVPIKSSGH